MSTMTTDRGQSESAEPTSAAQDTEQGSVVHPPYMDGKLHRFTCTYGENPEPFKDFPEGCGNSFLAFNDWSGRTCKCSFGTYKQDDKEN